MMSGSSVMQSEMELVLKKIIISLAVTVRTKSAYIAHWRKYFPAMLRFLKNKDLFAVASCVLSNIATLPKLIKNHFIKRCNSNNISNGDQPGGRVVLTIHRRFTSQRFGSLLVGYVPLKSPNNGETGLVLPYVRV